MSSDTAHQVRRTVSIAVGMIAGFAMVALVLIILSRMDAQPSSASEGAPAVGGDQVDQLTGRALADELGLELLPNRSDDCNRYTEIDDPAGYCLDGVAATSQEILEPGKSVG